MQKSLIYLIDDEEEICNLASSELNLYGYEVKSFNTGLQARNALNTKLPDLCIIDLGLPDMDGLTLVKEVFNKKNVGLLILSGRGSLPDRILGLELGADDYLTKPFEPRELVARVHSILRRIQQLSDNGSSQQKVIFADWTYYPATLVIKNSSGIEHPLSTAEAHLLTSFLKRPQQIVSRDLLLGEQFIPYDRSIDSRMSRLRKKIEKNPREPELIKTIYGAGYMLTCQVEWR